MLLGIHVCTFPSFFFNRHWCKIHLCDFYAHKPSNYLKNRMYLIHNVAQFLVQVCQTVIKLILFNKVKYIPIQNERKWVNWKKITKRNWKDVQCLVHTYTLVESKKIRCIDNCMILFHIFPSALMKCFDYLL